MLSQKRGEVEAEEAHLTNNNSVTTSLSKKLLFNTNKEGKKELANARENKEEKMQQDRI